MNERATGAGDGEACAVAVCSSELALAGDGVAGAAAGNINERCSSITFASFWLSSKSTLTTIDSRFSTRSRRSLFSSAQRESNSRLIRKSAGIRWRSASSSRKRTKLASASWTSLPMPSFFSCDEK